MMEFFLPIEPPRITAQMKRVAVVSGKPRFFDGPELADARAKLTAHLSAHRPETPLEGPVRLITRWCYATTKTNKNGQYKTTKPDTDNMIKLLKDCMTRCGFWQDDAQVASELTEKFWAVQPGIYVKTLSLKNSEGGGCKEV